MHQKKVQPVAPTCSLSQASCTSGRGRGGGGGGGWGGGARGVHYHPPPPNPPLCVCQNTPLWHLGWQTQLLSFQYFCYIQIEEVAVEDGLHHSSNNGYHVKESFKVEPPYPVDEVEGSVESQEEKVVGRDGLCLTCLADHEKLGQDGHRF